MNAKRNLRKRLQIKRSMNFQYLLLIFAIILDIFVFALIYPDSRLAILHMSRSKSYKTVEYRGARITYPRGLFTEEKLEVFYTVVDSLNDDVKPEFSISKIPLRIYVNKESIGTCLYKYLAGATVKSSMSIFLKPCIYNGLSNNGGLAMILVHEYIHLVQYEYPETLESYEENVGWVESSKKREDTFYSVLSEYSLTNSAEDMSDTFMFPYLCGNNLSGLSQERLNELLSFWSIPREEFCRNFN